MDDKEKKYRQQRREDVLAAYDRMNKILAKHNDDSGFAVKAEVKRRGGEELSLADAEKLLDQQLIDNAIFDLNDADADIHDEYRVRVRREREEDRRKSEEAVDRERNRMERWKKASGGKIADIKKSEKKSSGGKD